MPAPEVSRTKFAMVGDSITKASSKSLTSVLEAKGFIDIDIEAEVSRRIVVGDGKAEPLSGVKTLYTMLADGVAPDVRAFAMGTNDVGKYTKADEYADLIDQMLSVPDSKVPIVWVDVYNPNQLAATRMFNEVLRERAAVRGNTSRGSILRRTRRRRSSAPTISTRTKKAPRSSQIWSRPLSASSYDPQRLWPKR